MESNRRQFLKALAILGLGTTGCAPFLASTKAVNLAAQKPGEQTYMPILRAMMTAVVPFDHPQFPALTPADVEAQLQREFPQDAAAFDGFHRGLLLFNDVALFGHTLPPIAQAEEQGLRTFDGLAGEALANRMGQNGAHDATLHRAFVTKHGALTSFVEAPAAAQRDYFHAWSQSAFTLKRELFFSAKAMMTISAYSLKPSWDVMGYDGPLLEKKS